MISLQNYSTYSMLSGVGSPKDWAASFADKGYKYAALTDKSCMGGLFQFHTECLARDIKPILGQEFRIVNSRKAQDGVIGTVGELILIAKDEQGWRNLIWLTNHAHIKVADGGGFYFVPRLSIDMMEGRGDGIVAIIPLGSGPGWRLHRREDHYYLDSFNDIFDATYIGVNPYIVDECHNGLLKSLNDQLEAYLASQTDDSKMIHGAHEEIRLRNEIEFVEDYIAAYDAVKTFNNIIPVVNAHCPDKNMEHLLDVVSALDGGKHRKCEDRRMKRSLPSISKFEEIVRISFPHELVESSLQNLEDIANSVTLDISFKGYHMPDLEYVTGTLEGDIKHYILEGIKLKLCPECDLDTFDDFSDFEPWYDYLCYEATLRGETLGVRTMSELVDKLDNGEVPSTSAIYTVQEYLERIEHEISIISKLNFMSYFHVVYHIYDAARRVNASAGIARGSGGGSLLAWILQIVRVDALRHDLMFERFISEDRNDLPDFDMDFDADGVVRLIEFLKKAFGKERTLNIAAYSTLKILSGIQMIAKTLGYEIPDQDGNLVVYNRQSLSKALSSTAVATSTGNTELEERIESSSSFEAFYKRHKDWVDNVIMPLQGAVVNNSIHAAGILLLPESCHQTMPITIGDQGQFISHFDKVDVEAMGYPKYDILTVEGVGIAIKAAQYVKEFYGEEIPDVEHLPLDDELTLNMFKDGLTDGLFQFKTPSFKRWLELFEDHVDLTFTMLHDGVALIRPGTMESGTHIHYVETINGKRPIEKLDPGLESVLGVTFNYLIYQEQIMKVVRVVAGFTGSEADSVRRAVGKKKLDKMMTYESKFYEGAVSNGYTQERAEELWGYIVKFAGYGFNLAHSVVYALTAYYQAYIKARYPLAYMAASMYVAKMADEQKGLLAEKMAAEELGIQFKYPTLFEFYDEFKWLGGDVLAWPISRMHGIGDKAAQHLVDEGRRSSFESLEDFAINGHGGSCNVGVVEKLIKADFFSPVVDRMVAAETVFAEIALHKKVRDPGPDMFPASRLEAYTQRNEVYGFQALPWKELYADDLDCRVRKYTKRDLLDIPDGSSITICGRISGIEHRRRRDNQAWAKLIVEDWGESFKVYCWSEYWNDPQLDYDDIRPCTNQVVEIKAVKKSWSPPDDPSRVFPMLHIERGCYVRIIDRM